MARAQKENGRRGTAARRPGSPVRVAPPADPRPSDALTRDQRIALYYWMRLTRTLEERLVALYRQTKVVGGLFRSLGQEADAVGSTFALERRDIMSPLIRNLGSMLVKGATPVEVLRQYMARGDSPTRGRELNIHFGDLERGFIGQISPLGDMVPVMAGVTLTFRMRGEDRVGLVYVGDGATSTGAFHEGINFAAVQRCPLVVVVESNQYAYSTPTARQTAARQMIDKAIGYGVAAEQADGNDVLAVYDATKRATDFARSGGGTVLLEMKTFRMKGHAEHDDAKYVPPELFEQWRAKDPITRYDRLLEDEGILTAKEREFRVAELKAEIDADADFAIASPEPDPAFASGRVYADDGGPGGPAWH
jgi:TPP-dependent pyruvate/acetoin dehydrogenase alpha subunit